jgi:hypothetical protein
MTLQDWDREDYFVDFPELPPYTGPITGMPLPYKMYEVKKFVFDSIIKEVINCINSDSLIAAILLCLALIDYLAGYQSGHETTRDDYIGFLNDYFPKKYYPYSEFIYVQLRCSLMHNLSAINPWRDENTAFYIHKSKTKPHLIKDINDEGDPFIYFSVPIFLEDIRRAFIMYSHQLIEEFDENQDLVENFHSRFDTLEGRGSVMVRPDENAG